MTHIRSFLIAMVSIVALNTTSWCVYAQASGPTPKPTRPLPKSGTLSVSEITGGVKNKIPETWGGMDGDGKSLAPISGSVSRINPKTWEMKVFNTSEDTYQVNLSVIQRNIRNTQIGADSYSYTLKPGQNEKKQITAALNSTTATLELRSFKKVTKRGEKSEVEPEMASDLAVPTKVPPTPTPVRSHGTRSIGGPIEKSPPQ